MSNEQSPHVHCSYSRLPAIPIKIPPHLSLCRSRQRSHTWVLHNSSNTILTKPRVLLNIKSNFWGSVRSSLIKWGQIWFAGRTSEIAPLHKTEDHLVSSKGVIRFSCAPPSPRRPLPSHCCRSGTEQSTPHSDFLPLSTTFCLLPATYPMIQASTLFNTPPPSNLVAHWSLHIDRAYMVTYLVADAILQLYS